MIERLRELNSRLIELNINNANELKKQEIIKRILSEENCFLKIEIEYAYSILRDLQIKEEDIRNIYIELIDLKNNT